MAAHIHSAARGLRAPILSIALLATIGVAGSAAATPAKHRDRVAVRQDKAIRTGLAQNARVNQRCSWRRLAPHRHPSRTGRRARPRWRCVGNRARASTGAPVPLYWGASIGAQLTGTQAPWDMNAVAQFEGMAGKQLSLINFFAPFSNCSSSCWYYEFARDPMENIRRHGAIPVFSWSSQSVPSSPDEPDYQLSDVIGGKHDAYIREFAEDARDWGHPFFLRFDWEMNGNWFPWVEGVNGNQEGEYVAAWRHVHDIFVSVGATNATWVWCPNIDPNDEFRSLGSLYPGDGYVDWTCLDGYNWGPRKGSPWASFDRLYRSTYERVVSSVAPSKPLLIGEVGSGESGGSKSEWIGAMLDQLPIAYPQVRGMLWFNAFEDGMDWPIETSSSATEAFAAGIQDPSFQANSYAGLSASPIPPPS